MNIISVKSMRCTNTGIFRRIEIQLLMNLTARALKQRPKRTWTLPNDEALRVYAIYTRDHLQGGFNKDLLQRMTAEACKMGRLLRRVFFLKKQHDIQQFVIALYQNIGITLEGCLPGSLCFRRCFFSQYYTPQICLAASALDEGIMRGLAGSGHLRFQQRITEGCACCKATFLNDNDNVNDNHHHAVNGHVNDKNR